MNFLKIDGLFVKDIVDLPRISPWSNPSMIWAMYWEIAEFVENDDILKKLQEIGVDYAQGYGVGKPRPLAERAVPARKIRSAS